MSRGSENKYVFLCTFRQEKKEENFLKTVGSYQEQVEGAKNCSAFVSKSLAEDA